MFSGIIKDKAEVLYTQDTGVNRIFTLQIPKLFQSHLEVGSSIALDGICFTVKRKSLRTFDVEAMPQTLNITTASRWAVGDEVNFETPLRLGDEIGGHMIFGHVDEAATLKKKIREGTATVMTFEITQNLADMIVPRASVSLNGVSLTVANVEGNEFSISLLPATLEFTNLENLEIGDKVNLEIDMLMRYAHKQIHKN